ncbi:glycosyl hydrolase family 8 [Mesorhizobium sp. CAU 1741]|uniref:glycosyl hydrolase family 8 n=1 Tax=Mesorhizobium sp. CAU 1741 TaxID=3140366 RepID=UPI00325BC8A3
MSRAAALCVLGLLWPMNASSQPATAVIQPQEWDAYKTRFVEESGRVVDDANGNISHSEGQGYGLLLAWLAGSRTDFERIWSFTRMNLMLRDDGLAVWKWDPQADPPVTDTNNASDGDMLIAYALALAGRGWSEARFTDSAGDIAVSLAAHAMFEHEGRMLLSPGVAGFGAQERPDGPVVNLSYWVFEALPVLRELAPNADWAALDQSGRQLVAEAGFGARALPPDWLSLGGQPQPAQGFPTEFSYNAVRIPLYLIRAGEPDRELLQRMLTGMTGPGGGLALVDLESNEIKAELMEAGYRIIPALARCVLHGTPLPQDVRRFEPTMYYPSTLHLLALAHAREARPECL